MLSFLFDCVGFCQPRFETVVSELILVKNEALYAMKNLRKWMEPQCVERNLVRRCPMLSCLLQFVFCGLAYIQLMHC